MIDGIRWRAGFEVEVILGDLGISRFAREAAYEPMDLASPEFCRAVAKALTEHTGQRWTAPQAAPGRPGFYVVPEHGLDPLDWPRGRLAGVELLTPPLPFEDADVVRRQIADAIFEIDGDFNFERSQFTDDCGWHINIDAGDEQYLDPIRFIVGVDEISLLAANGRLFTEYTGLQRHSVGLAVLRHLSRDREGALLCSSGFHNLANSAAGASKRYAANFAKAERGYLELRHFSALAFLDGRDLVDELERIPGAMEMPFSQISRLEKIYRKKLHLLSHWLEANRTRFTWSTGPMVVIACGEVFFDGEPLGALAVNGTAEISLYGSKEHSYIGMISGLNFAEIAEGAALLALDLAEIANLGLVTTKSGNAAFRREIAKLAKMLKADPVFSSSHQRDLIELAGKLRARGHYQWDED
ncbi:hypothetical protein [Sphingopyxis sp. MG]|uniref:hypothetical protein n=1 Tax=Sphingopyxis sp. MG TaxID=1866325 RepID=UPI000CDF3334|nr:hypothetical protein [Sphingopyxis sp. MG]AVA14707.1 hypothetical protein C3E99_13325 [Sphingopyxis sp. MG]